MTSHAGATRTKPAVSDRTRWLRRVGVCLAAFAVLGCGDANQYVEPPPPEVTIATPTRREVTNYLETAGTTQPVLTVDIRARVKGFLKERHFTEGSMVKEGQLLMVIDEEPFRVALDQAKTRLAEAHAALQKTKQSRAREVARAQLAFDESQLRLADVTESRQRNLLTRNAGSRQDLDQAEANRKMAQARVEVTRATLDQTEADYETGILAAKANADAARTAVRNAEIELGYCRMVAPTDGRISRVNVHVGNLVGDDQASLLATIVKLQPIYAYINVSEYDLLRYRDQLFSGAPSSASRPAAVMELGLADEQGYPHSGRADYLDPAVDSGTGTIRVRGVFPNSDGSILPGMSVRVRIPFDKKSDALLVPERAIGTDQSGQFILVVGANDVVEYRKVEVGTRMEEMRVVSGKIGPEDRVIVEGLLRARPRQKVVPKMEDSTKVAVERKAVSLEETSRR